MSRESLRSLVFGMVGGIAVAIFSVYGGRNGSGVYTLPAGNPVVSGTAISSTVHNNTMSDIATALTNSLAKNGETNPTADLPMATFRHTNVGNPTARNQYATVDQVQDGDYLQLGSVSGTNTVTGSLTPALAAYVAGQTFTFTPANNNTGATTLNVNGIGALDVQKQNGDALTANDLLDGFPALVVLDEGADDFILVNPATLEDLAVTDDLTVTDALSVGGLSDFADGAGDATMRVNASGGIQVTGDCGNGTYNTAAGVGVELCETSSVATIQAYNRNTSNYAVAQVTGTAFQFSPSGGTAVDLTPQSGTGTATFDDNCTIDVSATFDWQRVGNLVAITFTNNPSGCTSDSSSWATTGAPLPASIRPAINLGLPMTPGTATNNGSTVTPCLSILSSGNIAFSQTGSFTTACGNWTSSGAKAMTLTNRVFTYMIGDP